MNIKAKTLFLGCIMKTKKYRNKGIATKFTGKLKKSDTASQFIKYCNSHLEFCTHNSQHFPVPRIAFKVIFSVMEI